MPDEVIITITIDTMATVIFSAATLLQNTTILLAIALPEWSAPFYLVELSIAYPIYYMGLSLWLQTRPARLAG